LLIFIFKRLLTRNSLKPFTRLNPLNGIRIIWLIKFQSCWFKFMERSSSWIQTLWIKYFIHTSLCNFWSLLLSLFFAIFWWNNYIPKRCVVSEIFFRFKIDDILTFPFAYTTFLLLLVRRISSCCSHIR